MCVTELFLCCRWIKRVVVTLFCKHLQICINCFGLDYVFYKCPWSTFRRKIFSKLIQNWTVRCIGCAATKPDPLFCKQHLKKLFKCHARFLREITSLWVTVCGAHRGLIKVETLSPCTLFGKKVSPILTIFSSFNKQAWKWSFWRDLLLQSDDMNTWRGL